MDFDELLKKTCEARGFSEGQVRGLMEAKKKDFGGLLTDEAALRIVAREAGVEMPDEEPAVFFSTVKQAQELAAGAQATLFVRVWNVFSAKKFEKEGRRGKVCNVAIRDATGEATLVLWNRDVDLVEKDGLERNDLLEIADARIKTTEPLEVHAHLLTRLVPRKEEELAEELLGRAAAIPKNPVSLKKISQISEAEQEFDFYCRLLRTGELKEFVSKTGKRGKVMRGLAGDETGQITLVLWDRNAELASRAFVGDALKIESAYSKKDEKGLEVHVGWKGRAIVNPHDHGLPDKEIVWKNLFAPRKIAELGTGEGEFIIAGTVADLLGAQIVRKCRDCNATVSTGFVSQEFEQLRKRAFGSEEEERARLLAEEKENKKENGTEDAAAANLRRRGEGAERVGIKCPQCSSTRTREFLVVNAELKDDSGKVRAAFFGRDAMELLGLKSLSVDVSAVVELKREYLQGKRVEAVVAARKSSFSRELEATVRHLVSLG